MTREDRKHGTTFRWTMTEECWSHWLRGLGERTVDEVIADGLREIMEGTNRGTRIQEQARQFGANRRNGIARNPIAEPDLCHDVSVTVPSRLLNKGLAKADGGDQDLRTSELLAAIILRDRSWSPPIDRKSETGNDDAMRQESAGWNDAALVASLSSLTSRNVPTEMSLRGRELNLLWAIAAGTLVSAAAAVVLASYGVMK